MKFRSSTCFSLWTLLLIAAGVISILASSSRAQSPPARQQQAQLQEELRLRTEKLRELLGRPMAGPPVLGLQKRPFCNAFTGCAGKRAPFALPSGDKQRLRFFRKFNSIDNSDSDEYVADNTNYDREMLQE